MNLTEIDPPRTFTVGEPPLELSHAADIELEPDELVTFTTTSGTQFDVVRKDWGYYGTPSLNGRLRESGLRAVLTVGQPRTEGEPHRAYLLLVEEGQEAGFEEYLRDSRMHVLAWLDGDGAVAEAAAKLSA